ncbi:MAG: hypothetical protein KKA56_00465 [Gammaproteobacteria bacterium]|nr:hypothetical protein [Gammaproteobacteria bacterium]
MIQLSMLYLAEAMSQQQKYLPAQAIFQRLLPAKIPEGSQQFYHDIQRRIAAQPLPRDAI